MLIFGDSQGLAAAVRILGLGLKLGDGTGTRCRIMVVVVVVVDSKSPRLRGGGNDKCEVSTNKYRDECLLAVSANWHLARASFLMRHSSPATPHPHHPLLL